ncbi:nucleoside 2-deoxyribosyltransferase, partial [Heyndrickxia coagulans]|uniref:nucleoside 2-deoxyribosyltransferase n=2 Tax=Bacillaceae TaxID=186817 RepID=UPI00062877A6
MKQKIFLAAPFKKVMDPQTSLLEDNIKRQIEKLISVLEEKGYSVHNAHKREEWGNKFMGPNECTKVDYEEIKKCDIFIAFPGIPASPGTHIEIGWASAFNKKIILLLLESEENYAYLIRGLSVVSNVQYIVYQNEEDYLDSLI